MSIKQFFIEAFKDAPIVGTGAATLFGVRLDTWVLILAALYGVARLVWLVVEAYWKWEDRQRGTGN
jgi:uncharacterized membrane protein